MKITPVRYPLFAVVAIFVLFLHCGQKKYPNFSGETAWNYLLRQCDFGPRNPGSEGYLKARNWLIEFLQGVADTVITQSFRYKNLRNDSEHEGMNIIGRFRPAEKRRMLLCAHYDTRPWADHDPTPENHNHPILGANDGASGVAVLLHVAEILSDYPPPIGLDIILFDGEDSGISEKLDSYCQGSQYFAQNPVKPLPTHGILLDMIGDAVLSIPMERYSFHFNSAELYKIWKIAQKRGFYQFKFELGVEIYDDHVPLNEIAGIRVIDLIDFEYPDKYRNYWHTIQDTPDKCSSQSLYVVGQTVVDYIYGCHE